MEGKDQVGLAGQQDLRVRRESIEKPTDPKELEVYEDLDTRARLVILDGVKDPLYLICSGRTLHMRCRWLFRIFPN